MNNDLTPPENRARLKADGRGRPGGIDPIFRGGERSEEQGASRRAIRGKVMIELDFKLWGSGPDGDVWSALSPAVPRVGETVILPHFDDRVREVRKVEWLYETKDGSPVLDSVTVWLV